MVGYDNLDPACPDCSGQQDHAVVIDIGARRPGADERAGLVEKAPFQNTKPLENFVELNRSLRRLAHAHGVQMFAEIYPDLSSASEDQMSGSELEQRRVAQSSSQSLPIFAAPLPIRCEVQRRRIAAHVCHSSDHVRDCDTWRAGMLRL